MGTKRKKDITLLVVDDEDVMRDMIVDYIEEEMGYKVLSATDGVDALENVLPNNDVDLIISDINMPRMKGFELLSRVRKEYPHIKRVLITAYNVEDYLDLAIKHNVGNIFVKSTPFNFDELSTILNNLIKNDIFGARRYMEKKTEHHTVKVLHAATLEETAKKVSSWLSEYENIVRLELVLIELLSNAVYYGARDEPPDRKETWNHNFVLSEEEAIEINVYKDSKKFAISILDKGGKLTKENVLYWLHRQIKKDKDGLPLGIMDSHGRGFFIVRKYIDRLLININKNKKTEVIIINYFDETNSTNKPLYINEL